MSPNNSRRQQRIAEQKRRAALYSQTPRGRYAPRREHSQAWLNAQRRRNRRIALQVFGAVAVLAAVIAVIIVFHDNNSDSTATDTTDASLPDATDATAAPDTTTAPIPVPAFTAQVVEGTSGALGITTTPIAYDVQYAVDYADGSGSASGVSSSTADYLIQRPFDSSINGKPNDPESAGASFAIQSSFGIRSGTSGGTPATGSKLAPEPGLYDFRFDATLNDLVASKDFVLGDRRTLLGRQCQTYRTGSAPEEFTVSAPTDTTYVDMCIDASGIILEEIAVGDGSLLEHLVATAVNESPTVTADTFKAAATVKEAADGGTSLDQIDATKAPVSDYWTASAIPAGYTLQGRYSLKQNIADPSATATTTPSATTLDPTATTVPKTIVVTSFVDVYVNGPNSIIVQQGPTSVEPQNDASGATATTSETLGSVQIGSGFQGSAALLKPPAPADWYVSVIGTVTKDALTQVVNSLHH